LNPGVFEILGVGVFLQTDGGLGPLGPQLAQRRPSQVRRPFPVVVGQLLVTVGQGQSLFRLNSDGGIDYLRDLQPTTATYYGNSSNAVSADMNGDGIPDLVLAPLGQLASITFGHGAFSDAGFGSAFTTNVGIPNNDATSIAVGDLNGDGRPDVAVVGTGPYAEIAILLNQCAP
jgi:hypothetical protein